MKVKIYVATHTPYDHLNHLDPNLFYPIHCGKSIYVPSGALGYLPELGDDTGDNISCLNKLYSELTAMYWIWKNDNESNIVGLTHYRRQFAEDGDRLEPIKLDTILRKLDGTDFIVNGASDSVTTGYVDSVRDSVYESYAEMHNRADMDCALKSINKLFPELYPKIEHEIKYSMLMCICNMLICRKEHFDQYCEFLFNVLEDDKVNCIEEHRGHSRACGYLSERLLRPWLIASGYRFEQGEMMDWERYICYKCPKSL